MITKLVNVSVHFVKGKNDPVFECSLQVPSTTFDPDKLFTVKSFSDRTIDIGIIYIGKGERITFTADRNFLLENW